MANPVVVFETSQGTFEAELYQDKVPVTVENFVQYVKDGHYDGTIFHRVIDGFMIQGGGFDLSGKQKATRSPIKNESGKGPKNCKYGLAMARTSDLNSATAQFYINVVDNDFLDQGQYCAFGKVTQGQDVIDKIKKVPVKKPGRLSEAQPVEPVSITSAKVKA
ncbi:MAG: peptidylprolyl isomerase [Planctomycetes bacterium]|nr:peptidylprolyl isomerase [Planctomycetota bacterium]